jgi:ABC-type transporter Mla maintaining outer membrane lipid asymmetry permease subunit MlaE
VHGSPSSRNPYLPPAAAGPDLPPGSVLRCGPQVFAWSLVFGTAYGLVAGAASNIQFAFGLRRLGGIEYLPRVIGLSAVRSWGPWGAVLLPAVTAVVVVHRAARRSSSIVVDPRLPFFAGIAAASLYPIVVTAGCLAALLVWCAEGDGSARTFVRAVVDALQPMDFAWGAASTALQAIVLALGIRFAGAFLRLRWHLVPKLLVVWVALQAVAFAVSYVGGRFP